MTGSGWYCLVMSMTGCHVYYRRFFRRTHLYLLMREVIEFFSEEYREA